MAKNMARLENGIVAHIGWYSDGYPESDSLKNAIDVDIDIGDAYLDGSYYRNGERILSHGEIFSDMQTALGILGVYE